MAMRRGVLLVLAGLVAAALGVAGSSSHALRGAELALVDARFEVRGTQAAPEDVVVVGLDARSLNRLGERPPIPRRYHARMINRLREADARVIGYDLQFQGRTTPRDDNALFRALDDARGVVLGTSIVRAGPETPFDPLAKATGSILGSTSFPERSARGGIFRRIPHDELGLPTFAVVAAGTRPDPDRFAGDGAWIDFAGPAGTVNTLSFVDVLRDRELAATLRGKIVVVGLTDPILLDVHPTSAGEGMPGPEIQANAIATILDDFPLREPPGWLAFLLIAGAGLLTPLAAMRLTGLRWLPVPALLAVGYPVAAQLAFNGGTILPLAAPLAAVLVGFLTTLAIAYATDVRERRRLRTAFARFVPAAMVDDLVSDQAAMGGVEREATVLFCDLRGFTTVAEQLPAPRVIELLNRYLTEMSDAILDASGTVVSYMGDGIMAVFGAPLASADHADRALRAAREMLGPRLAAFNAWAGQEMQMGIGVCTGPVMSGTVGSERRLEYAAVGDTTNTAARLEQMTKDAGVAILIADTTKAALRDAQDGLRHVGELQVRGRGATVDAFTLDP